MKFRMYQLQISKWIDSEEKICYKNAVYNITYEDNDTEAAVYGDYIIPTTLLTDKDTINVGFLIKLKSICLWWKKSYLCR